MVPTDDFSAYFLCALGVLLFTFLVERRKFWRAAVQSGMDRLPWKFLLSPYSALENRHSHAEFP